MFCRIVFVLFPGFQQLDLAGPMAVFELARLARPGSYHWRLAASQGAAVRSSAGVDWPVQPLPRALGVTDVVMVIGGDGVDAACRDARLLAWLRRAGASGARIASICSGSLVLAAAGLLDHRTATTHWSRGRQFASDFPAVHLQPDRIYVREPARRSRTRPAPEVWTSAGMTAGIDLCLALVAQDHGEELARGAARQLVVERRRPGGQTQFSSLLDLQPPEGRFGALLDHVRSHLRDDHRIEALAARACMSPRHFARCFREETGTTPAHAVERLRVEAARAALESGRASVQRLALDCGFGSTERMRRSFQRLLGRPPAAVRKLALAFAAVAVLVWSTAPSVALAAPPGDAARGRALLLQRQESGCILCHQLPGLASGGALGPPLAGLGSRYSGDELFQRIADARRVNPETIMPPYLSTTGLHNVARAQVGKTVLSEQGLADIVAYLLAPQGAPDAAR